MSYLDQFIESIRFLEKFDEEQKNSNTNYDSLKITMKNNIIEGEELNKQLDENIGRIANEFISKSPIDFTNKCHSASQTFYEQWSSQPAGILTPVAITIGNVKYKNKEVYSVSKSSIKRTMRAGFQPFQPLNVHVWLTLFGKLKLLYTLRLFHFRL